MNTIKHMSVLSLAVGASALMAKADHVMSGSCYDLADPAAYQTDHVITDERLHFERSNMPVYYASTNVSLYGFYDALGVVFDLTEEKSGADRRITLTGSSYPVGITCWRDIEFRGGTWDWNGKMWLYSASSVKNIPGSMTFSSGVVITNSASFYSAYECGNHVTTIKENSRLFLDEKTMYLSQGACDGVGSNNVTRILSGSKVYARTVYAASVPENSGTVLEIDGAGSLLSVGGVDSDHFRFGRTGGGGNGRISITNGGALRLDNINMNIGESAQLGGNEILVEDGGSITGKLVIVGLASSHNVLKVMSGGLVDLLNQTSDYWNDNLWFGYNTGSSENGLVVSNGTVKCYDLNVGKPSGAAQLNVSNCFVAVAGKASSIYARNELVVANASSLSFDLPAAAYASPEPLVSVGSLSFSSDSSLAITGIEKHLKALVVRGTTTEVVLFRVRNTALNSPEFLAAVEAVAATLPKGVSLAVENSHDLVLRAKPPRGLMLIVR